MKVIQEIKIGKKEFNYLGTNEFDNIKNSWIICCYLAPFNFRKNVSYLVVVKALNDLFFQELMCATIRNEYIKGEKAPCDFLDGFCLAEFFRDKIRILL